MANDWDNPPMRLAPLGLQATVNMTGNGLAMEVPQRPNSDSSRHIIMEPLICLLT